MRHIPVALLDIPTYTKCMSDEARLGSRGEGNDMLHAALHCIMGHDLLSITIITSLMHSCVLICCLIQRSETVFNLQQISYTFALKRFLPAVTDGSCIRALGARLDDVEHQAQTCPCDKLLERSQAATSVWCNLIETNCAKLRNNPHSPAGSHAQQ